MLVRVAQHPPSTPAPESDIRLNTLAIHVAIVAAVGIRLATRAATSPAEAMDAEEAPAAAIPTIGVMDAAMLITTAEAMEGEAVYLKAALVPEPDRHQQDCTLSAGNICINP
ncbi:hypothetical protein C8Q80DRAFT_1271133 [Daedaleopsis nitida]|nr:hypothetical protein C8Q80DRAFT_1271133 [Daedaleopsis nitida]